MPANHKVSVGWQIVFTFLPVVNFWAFYRIRKVTKYFFYVILPSIAFTIAIVVVVLSPPSQYGYIGSLDWYEGATISPASEPTDIRVSIISNIIGIGLQLWSIYLLIIWSRQHNKQFDQPVTQSTGP